MIHQYKVGLQEKKNGERERERERERETTFQERMWENNKKFIENNMRKKVKIKNIVINTILSKSCYVM